MGSGSTVSRASDQALDGDTKRWAYVSLRLRVSWCEVDFARRATALLG